MRVLQPAHRSVLVTGASGFIAAWVVRYLLERGHHVRGTVRNVKKGGYLQTLFKEYGTMFEYVLVEDISKDGAFDDACKGMDAVVHVASPFHFNADDPQEIIRPAVSGTVGILESVLNFAPTVKRVVITSSTAVIVDLPYAYDPTKVITYTEEDWYLDALQVVEEKGKSTPPPTKYVASKVLAEKSAWEFIEKHKEKAKFDLVALNPSFVFGPVIHEVDSSAVLNVSNTMFLSMLENKPPKSAAELVQPVGSYADVRDVAWAHAEAVTNDAVGNRDGAAALNGGKGRLILSAGEFAWQDVVDAINASSSALPKQTLRGEIGVARDIIHPVRIDSRRAREVLGYTSRPLAETFGDTLENFREKGWIE